jgi:hypothetical protein
VTVRKSDGELATYNPARLRGISAYREIEHDFTVGDRVQLTAPNRDLQVANRDLGTLNSFGSDGRITLRMDNGKDVSFDPREMRHCDHGYAVTSHSSQGLTSERVLVNMDTSVHPELIKTGADRMTARPSASYFQYGACRSGLSRTCCSSSRRLPSTSGTRISRPSPEVVSIAPSGPGTTSSCFPISASRTPVLTRAAIRRKPMPTLPSRSQRSPNSCRSAQPMGSSRRAARFFHAAFDRGDVRCHAPTVS